MISSAERRTRARALGVQEASIDRDFVLACLLAAHAENPDPFVFRGGTALARVYWVDFRLSEDIDLIASEAVPDLEERMGLLVGRAGELAGVPMILDFSPPVGGWSRSTVTWDGRELIVDVNMYEPVALPATAGKLDLPYKDLRDRRLSVPTVALPEILGNKWYMVDDRSEPRDLFDVWWGLCREGNDFADLARGHLAKYGFRPVRQVLNEARKRLPGRWEERLAHQLRALPEFDQVLHQVAGRYEAWEEAGKPISDR